MNASTTSRSLPGWLVETAEVLDARRRLIVSAAIGLTVLGGVVALVAPSLLPARAVVGAAVGLAAALLAVALGLAVDAADLLVRGSRHVTAAGGQVAARVAREPHDVGPLLALVARHSKGERTSVALTPASRSAGVPGARATALAEALARTGRKVLVVDLTRGGTPAAGLSDVLAGQRRLADVVRFEQNLYLARMPVGSDPDAALTGFAGWVEHLPSDLEVLVAALPPLAEPGVLAAAGAVEAVLVQVEVDRTERVDLIASLDAIDASGLTAEIFLVDPDRRLPEEPPTSPDAAATGEMEPVGVEGAAAADEDEEEAAAAPGGADLEPDDEPVGLADETVPAWAEPEAPAATATDEPVGSADLPDVPAPSGSDVDVTGDVPPAAIPTVPPVAPVPGRSLDDIWDEAQPQADTADVVAGQTTSAAPDVEPEETGPEPQPAEPESAEPEIAEPEATEPERPAAETDALEPERPGPAAAQTPTPVVDPDLDVAAQEAVRRSAALQAVARQVWQRDRAERR